jgi:toxin ParE1/3/4
MDFKIVWTDPALADLKSIATRIAADNPAAAEKFGAELFRKTDLLQTFPEMGAIFPKRKDRKVRALIHGNYCVFYRVKSDMKLVEILRIWHGARSESNLKFYEQL